MSAVDTRSLSRESLFILATLRFDGSDEDYRVKVRNLSSTGLMAEGSVRARTGHHLRIELRNIGWVEGAVVWVQNDRFGVAFTDTVDPQQVRNDTSGNGDEGLPRFLRPATLYPHGRAVDPSQLRKI